MIKFNEIKVGDYLFADNDGDKKKGEVTNLNGNEKQVCVDTGAQEFWYETEQLSPIPLDEAQLLNLKFHKQDNDDGTVKFMKGAFRMLKKEIKAITSMLKMSRKRRGVYTTALRHL